MSNWLCKSINQPYKSINLHRSKITIVCNYFSTNRCADVLMYVVKKYESEPMLRSFKSNENQKVFSFIYIASNSWQQFDLDWIELLICAVPIGWFMIFVLMILDLVINAQILQMSLITVCFIFPNRFIGQADKIRSKWYLSIQ